MGTNVCFKSNNLISSIFRYVDSQNKQNILIKTKLKNRMDRSHSKYKWYQTIRRHMKGIIDIHSMQGSKSIFGRWNLFQQLFTELFDKKIKLLMDKYALEYTALMNITLGVTYKYSE